MPRVVRGREAAARSARAKSTALRSGSAPAGEPLAQRLALEQLGDRVGRLAVAAEVVDREDVGMRERGDRLRLALEARAARSASRARRCGQHLDRDVAAEPRVARPVDLAHAAGAERRHDLVGAEPVAGREAHRDGTMGKRPAF